MSKVFVLLKRIKFFPFIATLLIFFLLSFLGTIKVFAVCTLTHEESGYNDPFHCPSYAGCRDASGTHSFLQVWDCYADGGWRYQQWSGNGDCFCGGGDSCFLSGTKIKMESGEKNIEEVKQGEVLVSFDPQSQKESLNIVKEPYSVIRDHYYTITTASGKVIKATDEHPFYTGEKSAVQKSLSQKMHATVSILYIYLQDGWQVAKQKIGIKV